MNYLTECIDQQATSLHDRLRVACHEIKNPLSALFMNFTLATRHNVSSPLTEWQLYCLARRIKDLTEFYFDSGYLETGKIEVKSAYDDLARIIEDIVRQNMALAANAGVDLTFRSSGQVFGWFDRRLIEQLVTNLVGNAIKYGKSHPVVVEASIEKNSDDQTEAVITVRDHGEGISPTMMDGIFEFGGRDNRIANIYEGQGLGLWISQQIVKALGGYITVVSQVGEGSIFTVHLPLRANGKSAQ